MPLESFDGGVHWFFLWEQDLSDVVCQCVVGFYEWGYQEFIIVINTDQTSVEAPVIFAEGEAVPDVVVVGSSEGVGAASILVSQ